MKRQLEACNAYLQRNSKLQDNRIQQKARKLLQEGELASYMKQLKQCANVVSNDVMQQQITRQPNSIKTP